MPEVLVNVARIAHSPASEGQIRHHRVEVDRPEAKGGTDQGPMGGELLLVSLGGCFMSNLIAAVKARGVEVDDLAVTVRGRLGGQPARFERAVLEVRGTSPDPAQLEKCVTVAERGCIVANTLKGSVQLDVRLV